MAKGFTPCIPDEGKIAFTNSGWQRVSLQTLLAFGSMSEREAYQQKYRQTYKDQAKRVNLTFSLPEISGLEDAAKSSGLRLSTLVKKLALQAFDQQAGVVPLPEEVEERLADLDRVVRNIANNVNQMARHSNRIEFVLDEQEVFLHLNSLEKELRKTIADLAKLDGEK